MKILKKVKLVNHPTIEHQLAIMRDKQTNSTLFRSCLKCLSYFIAYEASKHLETRNVSVETPLQKTIAKKNRDKVILIPILRAGLGMEEAFKEMLPFARIGHIGLFRQPRTKQPVKYYEKYPLTTKGGVVFLLDPMLASGHSAALALNLIKKQKPKSIKFCCIVSCPEGIEYVQKHHPDVEIYTAAIDKCLNKDCYIVPGLGDAGDRIFGTK
ncbi:uracil phosphoribosyltransferase [bacterium]|nr:uracil phosphoribosyltransferase [bacterium]